MSENVEALRKEFEQKSTAELIEILRGRDENEWRPEVFDVVTQILTARGESTEEVGAKGTEAANDVESETIVTIATFSRPADGHVAKTALEAEGIAAWLSDEAVGSMFGIGVGVRLQVRADDRDVARELLSTSRISDSRTQKEAAEPSCQPSDLDNVTSGDHKQASARAPAVGKRIRILEFLLVIAIAFSAILLASLDTILGGDAETESGNLGWINLMIHELLSIALLGYVLFRQNRRWSELVFRFSGRDLLTSAALAFAFEISYRFVYRQSSHVYTAIVGAPPQTSSPGIQENCFSLLFILFVIINPLFEELIVRAFLISEIRAIWQKTGWAVFASVSIQTTYHLYQGPVVACALAAGFLIYSVYYVKYKRIWPVILAHFYFDAYELISCSLN